MRDIDEMDLLYYLRVLAHTARDKVPGRRCNAEGYAYIDDVWPM